MPRHRAGIIAALLALLLAGQSLPATASDLRHPPSGYATTTSLARPQMTLALPEERANSAEAAIPDFAVPTCAAAVSTADAGRRRADIGLLRAVPPPARHARSRVGSRSSARADDPDLH